MAAGGGGLPSWAYLGTFGLLSGGAAVAYFLVSRGMVHLDLGLGRSFHDLGPITLRIAAPRDLVFEIVSAPYLGQMPAFLAGKIDILERTENLVVALHRTPLPLRDAVTVETVAFERPARVTFKLLRGPVPYVEEEFLLEERDGETDFTYRGELGADLWALGRLYGGRIVKPVWQDVVRRSLEDVKQAAEERAFARERRAGREDR
ncbi:MAG: SRPBCC family protein [Actinobacteria bacterium]|nr:SRPBCC family protein [Actinomycetota bacterium]